MSEERGIVPKELPRSEWLALGNAVIRDGFPRCFQAEDTHCIRLGKGVVVEVDGKRYEPGDYVWDRR